MANSKHLLILKQGVGAWNRWRDKDRSILPDLRNADLSNVELESIDLSGADLRGADFREVKLCGANLTNAKLSYVKLLKVNLSGADLSGATLNEAYLRQIDLSEVKLTKAVLRESNFSGIFVNEADLSGADLKGIQLKNVIISSTKLEGADFGMAYLSQILIFNCDTLSLATNLEYIKHYGDSSIDHLTLKACVNDLPYGFLIGVGYSRQEIKYLKSIYAKEINPHPCFVSFSEKDQDFTNKLIQRLRSENVNVLYASEDLEVVKKIRPEIDEKIRLRGKLLVVLSKNSIDGEWIEPEVDKAQNMEEREKKNILFPIIIDYSAKYSNETWLGNVKKENIADFTEWQNAEKFEKSFSKLIEKLKSKEE